MSPTQQEEALLRANTIRFERAQLFKDLNDGKISLSEAMEHRSVANMMIGDFFMKRRRWGDKRTRMLLSIIPIGYSVQMKKVTDRQRILILRATD